MLADQGGSYGARELNNPTFKCQESGALTHVSSLIVSVGQTLLMTSLAEYCGIWPTAGGQQYYIQALSTRSTRPFLSYVVGWAIMVGEISTGSSCALNSAQIIAAFVQIAHPGTEWKVSSS